MEIVGVSSCQHSDGVLNHSLQQNLLNLLQTSDVRCWVGDAVPHIGENDSFGLCAEVRPFGPTLSPKGLGEAWMSYTAISSSSAFLISSVLSLFSPPLLNST